MSRDCLVDCLPERFRPNQPDLWLAAAVGGAKRQVILLFPLLLLVIWRNFCADLPIQWLGVLGPSISSPTTAVQEADQLWNRLRGRAALPERFVLLPATSAIGSYKNPEILGESLCLSSLQFLSLVLCGVSAEQRADELADRFPHLRGRIHAMVFLMRS